jgi:hypothetical protein
MAVESMPITAHTPARAEPGHERIPPFRLDAKGHVVANRAPITLRKDEIEDNRRRDDAKDKKRDENDGENHERYTQESCNTAIPTHYEPRDFYLLREARADVR